jgi:hypothetical protein
LLLAQMTEPNEHYAHFTVTGGSILQGSGGLLVIMMLGMECCARDSNLRTSRFRGNARLFPFAKRRTLSYRIESTVEKPHDYDDSKIL